MKDDINCTKNSSKRFYMSEIFKSWMLCVKHKINNMTRHSDDLKHFVLKPSTDFLHLFWQPTISIRKCEVSSLIDRDDQITVTLYRWKSEFVGTAVARTNATRGPREGRSRSKGETTWLAANQQGLIDARETGSRRRQRKKRREEKREKGSNGTENGTKDVEDEERRSEVNDAERQMEGWRSRQGEDGERADCKSNEERRVRGSWRKRRTPWSSERREEERRGEEKRGEGRSEEEKWGEEGNAVQACRERQCQCACGRRVGWRCGSWRCVASAANLQLQLWTPTRRARVSNRSIGRSNVSTRVPSVRADSARRSGRCETSSLLRDRGVAGSSSEIFLRTIAPPIDHP